MFKFDSSDKIMFGYLCALIEKDDATSLSMQLEELRSQGRLQFFIDNSKNFMEESLYDIAFRTEKTNCTDLLYRYSSLGSALSYFDILTDIQYHQSRPQFSLSPEIKFTPTINDVVSAKDATPSSEVPKIDRASSPSNKRKPAFSWDYSDHQDKDKQQPPAKRRRLDVTEFTSPKIDSSQLLDPAAPRSKLNLERTRRRIERNHFEDLHRLLRENCKIEIKKKTQAGILDAALKILRKINQFLLVKTKLLPLIELSDDTPIFEDDRERRAFEEKKRKTKIAQKFTYLYAELQPHYPRLSERKNQILTYTKVRLTSFFKNYSAAFFAWQKEQEDVDQTLPYQI